jgi:5-methyltetrahydrofolate--homocysteine methyltransferase
LDGPDAVRHLPAILGLERLNCVQWIQGAGQPLPSQWLPLLQRIQSGGKSVQLYYAGAHGGEADFAQELDALCGGLDRNKLFVVIEARSVEEAEALVRQVS